MPIDVFVPSIPFSDEALTIFKLLFFRPKDLADLERLVAVQGPALDRAYVRTWIVDMMGDTDERVRAWDDLDRRFAARDA